MRSCVATFYFEKDMAKSIKENASSFVFCWIIACIGLAIGVYVAIKIPTFEPPYGIFSYLFRCEYTPFVWLRIFFLRFLLYFLLASVGYVISAPYVFTTGAIILFSKYIGQVMATCYLTDAAVSAIFSIILIYFPIFVVGIFSFFYLLVDMNALKICGGNGFSLKIMAGAGGYLLKIAFIMFLLLLLLFVALCGVIYLFVVAV